MTVPSPLPIILLLVLLAPLSLQAEGEDNDHKFDINIASAQELAEIPFIDSKLAEAIVSYREKVGGFVMFEELLQVEGFNRDLFKKVKSYLFLDGISAEDCGC